MYRPTRPPRSMAAQTDWGFFLDFIGRKGKLGQAQLTRWENKRARMYPRHWPTMRSEFESFTHRHLYHLTAMDIQAAAVRTEHSLGNLQDTVGEKDWGPGKGTTEDWSPPCPFFFIWHSLLERDGRIPLWQEAWRYLLRERLDLVAHPFAQHFGAREGWLEGGELRDGFQWRLGKSYYSFLRETEVLVKLRRLHGLDVLYHFLIDAEWAADAVGGQVLAAINVGNPKYSEGKAGRKRSCAELNPGFEVVKLQLKAENTFGKVWRASDEGIAMAADRLKKAGCPTIPQ